jgi:hypothetical protein
MPHQNRKATADEMEYVRQIIAEAFPEYDAVFGGHSSYGGHRAPRDHTISFRLRDQHGTYHSNVVWLSPEWLSSLTPGNIRWLVNQANGKRKKPKQKNKRKRR